MQFPHRFNAVHIDKVEPQLSFLGATGFDMVGLK